MPCPSFPFGQAGAGGGGGDGPFDGKVAVLMALATLVGGALTWAFNALNKVREQRRQERKEDEKTIVQHLEELKERLTKEVEELHAEVNRLRDDLTKEQIFGERVMGYLRYLESLLKAKRIPFDAFVSVLGTGSAHEMPAATPSPADRKKMSPRGEPEPEGPGDG